MVSKKSNDHWSAFLEEIEAPMWVDLTTETKLTNQDINDEWFNISHPFHQCSSRQLKSQFSYFGEGNAKSEFDIQGQSSPKLLSSVSRSRGKHYRNKEWGRDNHILLSNKQHPVNSLSGKIFQAGSGSSQETKLKSSCGNLRGVPSSKTSLGCENILSGKTSREGSGSSYGIKAKSSFGILNGVSSSKRSLGCESRLSGKSSWAGSGASQKIKPKLSYGNFRGDPNSKTSLGSLSEKSSCAESGCSQEIKPKSSYGKLKGVPSSKTSFGSLSGKTSSGGSAIKAGESNASTITSESNQQQQRKAMDVSGHTSGLLSAMRISLRKSCVTRPASRVEINDGRPTNGRKSSSSKSSVGSSSNPGLDILTGRQNKDETPDSRNVERLFQAAKNRVKVSIVSKATSIRNASRTSDCRMGGKSIAAKCVQQQAAKSKGINQLVKALVPRRVNEQGLLTAPTKGMGKVSVNTHNRFPRAGAGKENAVERMVVGQKSSSRDIAVGGVVKGQRVKPDALRKGDRIGLISFKEKINGRPEEKNAMRRVYIR